LIHSRFYTIDDGDGALARGGLFAADENWQPTDLILDTDTIDVEADAPSGDTDLEFDWGVILPAGRYLNAFKSNYTDPPPINFASWRVWRDTANAPIWHDVGGTEVLAFVIHLEASEAWGSFAGTEWDSFNFSDFMGIAHYQTFAWAMMEP